MRKGATSQPSNGGGDFALPPNAMGEPVFNSPLNAVTFPGTVAGSGLPSLPSGYLSGLPWGNSNLQFTLPSMSNFSLPTSLFPSPLDLGQLQPPPSPRTLPVFSSEMSSGHRLFDAPETQATSHPLAQYYADRAHQQAVSRAIMRPAPVAGGLFRGTGDGGLFDGLMRQYPLVAGVNRYLSLPESSGQIPHLPAFSSAAGSPDTVLNNPANDTYRGTLGQAFDQLDYMRSVREAMQKQQADLAAMSDEMTTLRNSDPNLPGWGVNYNRTPTTGDALTAGLGMSAVPSLFMRFMGPIGGLFAEPVTEFQNAVLKKYTPSAYDNSMRAMAMYPDAARWGSLGGSLLNSGATVSQSLENVGQGAIAGGLMSAGGQMVDNALNNRPFSLDLGQMGLDSLTGGLFGGHPTDWSNLHTPLTESFLPGVANAGRAYANYYREINSQPDTGGVYLGMGLGGAQGIVGDLLGKRAEIFKGAAKNNQHEALRASITDLETALSGKKAELDKAREAGVVRTKSNGLNPDMRPGTLVDAQGRPIDRRNQYAFPDPVATENVPLLSPQTLLPYLDRKNQFKFTVVPLYDPHVVGTGRNIFEGMSDDSGHGGGIFFSGIPQNMEMNIAGANVDTLDSRRVIGNKIKTGLPAGTFTGSITSNQGNNEYAGEYIRALNYLRDNGHVDGDVINAAIAEALRNIAIKNGSSWLQNTPNKALDIYGLLTKMSPDPTLDNLAKTYPFLTFPMRTQTWNELSSGNRSLLFPHPLTLSRNLADPIIATANQPYAVDRVTGRQLSQNVLEGGGYLTLITDPTGTSPVVLHGNPNYYQHRTYGIGYEGLVPGRLDVPIHKSLIEFRKNSDTGPLVDPNAFMSWARGLTIGIVTPSVLEESLGLKPGTLTTKGLFNGFGNGFDAGQ